MFRRTRNENGTALVESAVALPILILLTFALIDGGMFFKSYLSLSNAAGDAARSAANAGRDPLADYDALQEVKRFVAGTERNALQQVIIFNAESIDSIPTPVCLRGRPSSAPGRECNVYSPEDLDRPREDFQADAGWGGSLDWDPMTRVDSRGEGPDLVGVYITAKVSTPFSTLGSKEYTTNQVAVFQIEARTQ